MNKQILMIMDLLANPNKYTIEQLKGNLDEAYNVYDANAYDVVYSTVRAAARAAYTVAVYAYNPAYANNDDVNYWLNSYFKQSGENKQDYIDEITKGYKHDVNYWLKRYFKYSGENKQDYIDEINKGLT